MKRWAGALMMTAMLGGRSSGLGWWLDARRWER